MSNARYWLTHFFDDSLSLDVDQKRRLYSFLAFSYFGIVMLLTFSYSNFMQESRSISTITLIGATAILANLLLYYIKHNLQLCCTICGLFMIFFCLALVHHGGIENTALYWVFPFPMVIFVLLGRFLGFWFNCLLFLSLVLLLALPEYLQAQYRAHEGFRFLASLFAVNAISYINEHYRERSHIKMSDLNLSKEQQANTDALTHLPNRRFVDAVFFPTCKTNINNSFPMVLIMADVDLFKRFNDDYGHQMGDEVLTQLSRTIEQCIRSEDIVARVGGEEFLLLFSQTTYDIGLKIAEKVRKKVATMKIIHDQKTLRVTMSFGVAIAYSYGEIESKLKDADAKLYQAKDAGRNCIL
ncbi:hypothetical protein A9Q74_04630 [Colwellia sp. 39_35_sub15_T18]|nr:hypothetical protein A9Q74_04630 [Colwellia sp. 39_35_sub15_T18]